MMRFFYFLLGCLLLAPLQVRAAKPQAKPSPTATAVKSSSEKEEDIDLPAPVGEEMKGITIPQYDPDGHLRMKFYAETARKIDEHNVEIQGLKIDFFEKDGKDVTVMVPHSLFNLETKILSADTPTTLKREDFDMVGESATFDTVKRFGTMKGHVHTEIRNGVPSN